MWAIFTVVFTPEQAMQAAISKNMKLTQIASPVKQSLPMPPGMNPSNIAVVSKPQNAPKPFLPPPPTPPKILTQQSSQKRPPLPSARPPLPVLPPPPPPPSIPPPLPASNQILIPPSIAPLPPPPPMQPPPIQPATYPMYPYPPLQNAAQPFANPMFSQPPNLISAPVPPQYRPHEAMPPMGVQYMGEAVPPRPNYNDNYNPRDSIAQQQPHPYNDYDMQEGVFQDSYDENRQKYNDSRSFNRDAAYVGGSFGNGSQHYGDGSQLYGEGAQHYGDVSSQHYSDAAYQQFRGGPTNKRGFNNRGSRPPPPPTQYQNRQVRNHPYQRR